MVPVVGGVLDALGGNRGGGLGEAGPQRRGGVGVQQEFLDQRGRPTEDARHERFVRPGSQRLGVGGRQPLAGDGVGAVARERGEQTGDRLAHGPGRMVAAVGVVGAGRQDLADQPLHFRVQLSLRAYQLGLAAQRRAGRRAGRGAQGAADTRAVRQHAVDVPQRVVAGGAGAGPVGGEALVAGEDLLDDDVGTAGGVT